MKEINIFKHTGKFAGNKDIARDIRINILFPMLDAEENLALNFSKVESATQSFIHALISEVIRQKGVQVLERIYFKECNETIKIIIRTVTEYMQESNS